MKKIIKPVVMVLVFLSALVAFSFITNQTNEDMTTTMKEATLPVISFYYDNVAMNELHGYVNEMDKTLMRDSILPIEKDRVLHVNIDTYGSTVDDINYEIRSLDGERLMADGELTDYSITGNHIDASFEAQNILEKNEEYLMIFKLRMDQQTVYYYTRIMQTQDYHVDECLDFAFLFHEYTFREDAGQFIPTYMDPATGDATTLNYVDLSCTLKQLTWADFKGNVYGDIKASFKEINDSYNVIALEYVLTSTNENGEIEYYNIEESFRLRYTDTRMYVLNFERRMNQIFRGENTFITDLDNILLGIRDLDVDYAASESQDVIAFVQEGELWCYNAVGNELESVFSFRSNEGMDLRENFNQHEISIVRLDEAGSVDFIVYGYMNRGDHEGEVGVGVYHYDGIAHTVEEEAFLPVNQSYQVLKAELGQLMYQNDQGSLYFMMNGTVYEINLHTLKVKKLITNLTDDCYASSDSNRYFAWVEGKDKYASNKLSLMDFKSGKTYEIEEKQDEMLRPLEFIGDDFIYGIAKSEEIEIDAAGNTIFPMYALKIMNTSQESTDILKTYQPLSGYVSQIAIKDFTIEVELIQKENGQYVSSGEDAIMNREADAEGSVYISTLVTDLKETQVQLIAKGKHSNKKTKLITSQGILVEEPRLVDLNLKKEDERYYVYVKGGVALATDKLSEAISRANEMLGVVLNSNQQYVWMRARKSTQPAFKGITVNEADLNEEAIVQSISAILMHEGLGISVKNLVDKGDTPKTILENALKDYRVFDLTGCTVEEMLFYVSKQSLVFAMTGSNSAVLINGYSASNLYYYDPMTKENKSISLEAADELFSGAGNIFFTYLKK